MADDTGRLTERQQLALSVEALVAQVTVAEVRRRALGNYADRLLANPNIAEIVRYALRYRRERGFGRPVTKLRTIGEGGPRG